MRSGTFSTCNINTMKHFFTLCGFNFNELHPYVAVGWGIGNKKPTARACAEQCKSHK